MTADVCLLLEGSYPYVEGGVSSWTHALIRNLPDYTFALVHLGSMPDPERVPRYQLPENVVSFHEIFIHDPRGLHPRAASTPPAWARGHGCGWSHSLRLDTMPDSSAAWKCLRQCHEALAAGRPFDHAELLRHLDASNPSGPSGQDLLHGPESWDLLVERYGDRAHNSSFVDFFWTFRFTHLPLFVLLEAPLPEARLYHSVSAGFNAFLGVLAKMRSGAPLIVTEHGIYTREREIEIAQAEWVFQQQVSARVSRHQGFLQEWWIGMFRYITKLSYDFADCIISITRANQRYQLQNGADPKKLMVIPNAIDVDRLSQLWPSEPRIGDHFIVGFVGRVVPIKDVKTFIRAIKMASNVIPGLLAYIIGPTDEDPDYFKECQQLVALLELSDIVRFTGRADVRDYYRLIDVLALTSLSEAMPLVILEANCAGIPAVATDVGACRTLLTGDTAAERALGASGLVTPAASPGDTADALIRLWQDDALRQRMGRAGRERVQRFYREDNLWSTYRALYQSHLQVWPVGAPV